MDHARQDARPVPPCDAWTLPCNSVRSMPTAISCLNMLDLIMSLAMAHFLAPLYSRFALHPFSRSPTNFSQTSFIAGPIAYRALPRPQFSSLQQAIFPIYFTLQSALPAFLALTYPGTKSSLGSTSSGIGGFLAESNRYSVLAPLVTVFAINVTNLLVLGPATTKIMRERKHQGM